MRRNLKLQADLAELDARRWNDAHPIGTPVRYWSGAREGEGVASETRSEAWELCGSAVVAVKGKAGGIALTHVEVIGDA